MDLPTSKQLPSMSQIRKRGRPSRILTKTIGGRKGANAPISTIPLANRTMMDEGSQIPISAQVVAVSPLDTSHLLLDEQQGSSASFFKADNDGKQKILNSNNEKSNLDMSQPARSWWRYFRKLKEENRAICLTCGQAFNRGAKQSTTSLSHHLKMYHRNLYINVQMARDEQTTDISNDKKEIIDNNHGISLLNKLNEMPGKNAPKFDRNNQEVKSQTASDVQWVGTINKNGSFSPVQSKQHLQMMAKRLIRAVRQFPELYISENGRQSNPSSAENLDRIWTQVKQMVEPNSGDNVLSELKRRWFHLREKFKKELRIVLRDNFAYKPKWPHFKELIWLAAHFEEFRNISHLLEEFVSNQNVQLTIEEIGNTHSAEYNENPQKLDDLLLPMDFEDVLRSNGRATSTKHLTKKDELFHKEDEELKQELDEQELREVANALGIDMDGVQNGQMKMELEDVDTSFLTDKNGCCPSKEAIQTIGYMLMKNGGCSSSANMGNEDGCCDNDGELNRAPSTSCGCNCTKIESSDEDEIGKQEREFGLDIARRLTKLDKGRIEIVKTEILCLFDREEFNGKCDNFANQ